ncbi:hypothetical protein C8A00DRAFT_39817 [Chaetomidium leptoderma]|uniref:Sm domain-containing protein n=1 Tax=Chaetomidium leptoderma TaxID=669021 RepID=A0AAN6VUS3_9PEZI|nr:hypothetical protein C8A00DRAFT_39817 [Chaetomidium leptoderma]
MSTPTPPTKPALEEEAEEATTYLRSLLNKNLRVTTTDNRMFWGAFKCTDSESNIVLQHTYEYRHPTNNQIIESAAAAAGKEEGGEGGEEGPAGKGQKTMKMDMTSRYLGLVVVPGKYIVRIEAEEFASQMRGRQMKVLGVAEQGIVGGVAGSAGVAV